MAALPALPVSPRRRRLADALGLAFIVAVLLDLLQPSLLLLPTISAGGDTPCHYPTAVWLKDQLLPHLRLHGWYPGTYLGQPLLLTYFPLPFLVMAALSPLLGMPVAFKLGTVLGVFLLPLFAYVSLRRMRLPFPAPLCGAAAALVFLYVEENPIWGGTIASTLTGEFSYTYGIGLATLFLGELVRAREDGRGPWLPATLLALTSYAHGYAVLWAGLTASGLLFFDRRPLRALGWLASVAALAGALAAPSLVPLLAAWGWTTPYDDAWIDMTTRGLLPALLWPLFACAVAGVALRLVRWRSAGVLERRLLLLGWGACAGAALTCAGPGLGVIDVRFAPFAQLALVLCGAAVLGLILAQLALADVAAVGFVLLAAVWADTPSRVLRSWIDWNYSGLEAKELWPAWSALCERIRGSVSDPRVSVEYDPLHERAGSLRMYETLFYFSGRATLEGVYNQASTSTHPVYYLASELFARSPNPFRGRRYSRFDPENALARLRLFNVSTIVTTSPALTATLAARSDVLREAEISPYTVFRLRDPGPGYVEPLAFEPVRAPLRNWRDQSYRWYTRKPPNRALLVFSNDPRFTLAQPDPWGLPPERPLPGGVQVRATVAAESIRIETDRPGHPLLVKISYHPRWRAEGAAGPYLVSPGLMLIVPNRREVLLHYEGRTRADWLGFGLALAAAGVIAVGSFRGRRLPPGPPASSGTAHAPRLLRALPLALGLGLASLRLFAGPASQDARIGVLWDRSARASAQRRWPEAAELARYALDLSEPSDPRFGGLQCLRGEALLQAGDARGADAAYGAVLDAGSGPYRAQALYGGALAREAASDGFGAAELRRELRESYAATPWAARLAREQAAAR